MTRVALWREIAATLSAEIGRGHFGQGDKLPTEQDLAARFSVNRHTIRHALADLAARLTPTDQELKLGVFTALIGAPFLLWLLHRSRAGYAL